MAPAGWAEETPAVQRPSPGPTTRRGALQGHSGAPKKLLAIHCTQPPPGRLDSVLPPEQEGEGRESEVDDLRNSTSL